MDAQRRGDASQFGPPHMKDGKIKFTPAKTSEFQTVQWLPAAPQLVEAIDALPAIGTRSLRDYKFRRPLHGSGLRQ